MIYEHISDLPDLLEKKLITRRAHPHLPLYIYNYSASAQSLPMEQWNAALCDCRGLILDLNGEIVARPFKKFWNYERVLDRIPINENFNVWEKCDGSLGILCYYGGEYVVATRGSFESEQARWFNGWLHRRTKPVYEPGLTYLFELIFPANRIVVDYGKEEQAILLAILNELGEDLWQVFDNIHFFKKAKRYKGVEDFSVVNSDPQFEGKEGFVIQWDSGFRAKVKSEEYKRLHRLITQCSTRTIWELLRAGSDTTELVERVPEEFKNWVTKQIEAMNSEFNSISMNAMRLFNNSEHFESRKEFALWAMQQSHPNLLFSLLDNKPFEDAIWKLIEPKWATPFRKEIE